MLATLIGRVVALLALRNAWRARHDALDRVADTLADRSASIRFGSANDTNLYRTGPGKMLYECRCGGTTIVALDGYGLCCSACGALLP
jgi:hypothetical protein